MLWIGRKMTSTTPKNNIGAYKRSPFSQRTENRDKDKQSPEDSKGTSKTTFYYHRVLAKTMFWPPQTGQGVYLVSTESTAFTGFVT